MKILILAPWGIGDFLFISKVIDSLKNKFPNYSIIVFTRNNAVKNFLEEIYQLEVINLEAKNLGLIAKLLIFTRFNYYFYSYGISKYKLFIFNLFIRSINTISSLNYYKLEKSLRANHRIISNRILYDIIFKDKLIDSYYLPLSFNVGLKETDVVIHVGSDNAQLYKRWPIDYWVSLVKKLEALNFNIGVIFGPSEKELIHHFNNLKCRIYNNLTFTEVVNILDKSKLLISSDSGIAHIASSRNLTTITLFGPSDKKVFAPFVSNWTIEAKGFNCTPCITVDGEYGCKYAFCMMSIDVERVYIKALNILNV